MRLNTCFTAFQFYDEGYLSGPGGSSVSREAMSGCGRSASCCVV